MRKIHIFLSLFIVGSFLLAACGASGDQTGTPGAVSGTPAAGAGVTGTPAGSTTTNQTETPAAVGTAGSSSTATGMPSAASPTVMATQEATQASSATQVIPNTGAGSTDPGLLSNEMQFQVTDPQNQPLGQVKDIVLDLSNLKIAYIVVGLTSAAATSGKEVAIPWNLIQAPSASSSSMPANSTPASGTPAATMPASGTPAATMPASSNPASGTPAATMPASSNPASGTPAATMAASSSAAVAFIFTGDSTKLAAAPDFSTVTVPQLGQPAGTWDADIISFWNGSGTSSSSTTTAAPPTVSGSSSTQPPASSGTTSTPSSTQPSSTTGTASAPSTTQAASAAALQGVALASKLMGASVTDSANQQVGTVLDAVVNLSSGAISYVVLTVNGKLIPVPPQGFGLSQSQTLVLTVTSQVVQGAPSFSQGSFPMTSTTGWDAQIVTYWQSQMQPTKAP